MMMDLDIRLSGLQFEKPRFGDTFEQLQVHLDILDDLLRELNKRKHTLSLEYNKKKGEIEDCAFELKKLKARLPDRKTITNEAYKPSEALLSLYERRKSLILMIHKLEQEMNVRGLVEMIKKHLSDEDVDSAESVLKQLEVSACEKETIADLKRQYVQLVKKQLVKE